MTEQEELEIEKRARKYTGFWYPPDDGMLASLLESVKNVFVAGAKSEHAIQASTIKQLEEQIASKDKEMSDLIDIHHEQAKDLEEQVREKDKDIKRISDLFDCIDYTTPTSMEMDLKYIRKVLDELLKN